MLLSEWVREALRVRADPEPISKETAALPSQSRNP
jgi:hypothetical protein